MISMVNSYQLSINLAESIPNICPNTRSRDGAHKQFHDERSSHMIGIIACMRCARKPCISHKTLKRVPRENTLSIAQRVNAHQPPEAHQIVRWKRGRRRQSPNHDQHVQKLPAIHEMICAFQSINFQCFVYNQYLNKT